MGYFNTKTVPLFYSCDLPAQEQRKIDGFLSVLEKSGCVRVLSDSQGVRHPNLGRAPYDPCSMFALVVYSFSMRRMSLRDMEDFCRYDIRARYIMSQETPSFKTICDFLNRVVFPVREQLFSMVNKAILSECGIDASTVYIDGTKVEADANKYKFVWKPRKTLANLRSKISADFGLLGMGIAPESASSRTVSSMLARAEALVNAKVNLYISAKVKLYNP